MTRARVKRCGIPSHLIGTCDLAWGHDGIMHANDGDGFYAIEHEAKHRARQRLRETRKGKR